MTDLARLGLYVDSTGVVRATDHMGKFAREGKRAEGIAGKFGKTGTAAFGAVAAAAAGAVAAIASIGSAVQTIRQFESSMSQVSAITGATRGELEALRDVAKDLGSTTEFSASQAADGLRFLGMAGFSAAESIKAIPAVLDLATASSMGLAESADIASNVLSGFGLEAGQAAQVADVLAAASSSANTSVSQLGRAMSTVAPISAALGIDLADTAAAIGVLSDAGIQGERAGTALRGVLASLAGPTTQAQQALAQYGLTAADVNPETQSLTEIFGLLEERGLTTADAMTIFGREAASGALVLADASDRVGQFGDELRGAEGAASDMAGIMRDNLAGSANSALSALQGLAIAIGEAGLTAILRGGLAVVTEFARGLTEVVSAVGDFFAKFQGQDRIQAAFETATDNVTIALGDQIRQLGQLQQAMENSGAITLSVAEGRLAEAQAIREVIAAEKEQLVQKTLLEAGYGELLGRLEATRAAMRGVNAALSEGDGAAAMQVESYRQLEQTMISLLEEQEQMLISARETVTLSEAQEQALADADAAAVRLRKQIENLKNGLVLVNGEWVEVVELSDRSAVSAANLSNAVASINFSAPIEGARRLARNLEVSLHQAMQMMGLLGEAAQASRDVVIFDPRDPRYDAAAAEEAARLERISNIMNDLASSAKVVVPGLEDTASAIGSAGKASGGASKSVEDLNENLEATNPLLDGLNGAFGQMVDYMFDGFKDGMAGIWDIFVNTLKQMAAAALKNKITIGLGLSATGIGGAAAAGQGGGILSNALGLAGGGGSFLGGVASGLGGVLSGGGLASSFANLGGMLSGSVGITGGAIGAALPALGIVAAPILFALAMKKTEVVVAEGVRARIEGAMLELDSYEKTKTNNGLGISSGFSRDFERLDDAVQAAVGARLDATTAALGSLGFGTDLTGFSFSKRTEIKDGETFEGESEEVIREALNAAIEYLTDGALEIYQQAGEDVSQTLDRMIVSFNGVNEALYLLDQSLLPVSLDGAAAATALLDLSGGLDAFNAKTATVFQGMLTDAEQQARLTEIAMSEMTAVFGELNAAIPETHAEFMALLDAQDLTTESGREAYAALLGVAGAFVQVNGTAQQAADAAAAAAQGISQAAGAVSQLGQAAQALSRRDVIDPGLAVLQARASEADSAVGAAEDALRAAFEAQANQISGNAQLEIDRINEQAARAEQMVEAANARVQAEAQAAVQVLRETQSATIESIRAATALAIEQLGAQIDTARDRVELYRAMSGALESAFNNRRVLDALGMRNQGAWATQFLRSAVMAGGTEDLVNLERALDIVADPATSLFKSFADYQQDFNVNTNLIESLKDVTDGQLTIEEKALATLEQQLEATRKGADDQIAVLEMQTDREIAAIEKAAEDQFAFNRDLYDEQIKHIEQARDEELAAAQEQMNALLGIDTSVMSVEDAIANLNAALTAQQAAQDALNVAEQDPTEFAAGSFAAQLDAIFRAELGRGVRASGLEYYGQQYIGGTSIEDIARIIANSQEAQLFDATGVPMFANGGTHRGGWRMVGERGPELEYTAPSRIYSNRDTRAMIDNTEVVDQLKELNTRTRDLQKETKRQARILNDWTTSGQPGTRAGEVVKTEAA